MLLAFSGLLSLAASVTVTAIVMWFDLSHPDQVSYVGMATRIAVIGGFFLFLGRLMWRIGTSLMASHHRLTDQSDGDGAR